MQLEANKVSLGRTGAAVVLRGDLMKMGSGSADATLGAALLGDSNFSLSADVDDMLGAAFRTGNCSIAVAEQVSCLMSSS